MENDCNFGETVFFGTLIHPEHVPVPIDNSRMTLHVNLMSNDDRNIYNVTQWLSLDVLEVRNKIGYFHIQIYIFVCSILIFDLMKI